MATTLRINVTGLRYIEAPKDLQLSIDFVCMLGCLEIIDMENVLNVIDEIL